MVIAVGKRSDADAFSIKTMALRRSAFWRPPPGMDSRRPLHGPMLRMNRVNPATAAASMRPLPEADTFHHRRSIVLCTWQTKAAAARVREHRLGIGTLMIRTADERITCTVSEVQFSLLRQTRVAAIHRPLQLPQSRCQWSRRFGGK